MSFPPTPANIARALALIPPIFTHLSTTDPDHVTHRSIRRALIERLIAHEGVAQEAEGVFEVDGEEARRWKGLLREEVERCMEREGEGQTPSPVKAKAKAKSKPLKGSKKGTETGSPKARLKEGTDGELDKEDSDEPSSKANRNGKGKARVVESEDEDESEAEPPKPFKKTTKPAAQSSKASSRDSGHPPTEVESDSSSGSSLIDEPPRKEVKNKNKTAVAKTKADETAKITKSSSSSNIASKSSTSADEAKVNELKKIVTACGMRKRWKSEFAGFEDDSRRQVKHLQGVLSAYGIKGAPTLGKAKKRRAEVEAAAELADIQEVAAKHGLGSTKRGSEASKPSRPGRSLAARKSTAGSHDSSEEDDAPAARPKKKKKAVASSSGAEESD